MDAATIVQGILSLGLFGWMYSTMSSSIKVLETKYEMQKYYYEREINGIKEELDKWRKAESHWRMMYQELYDYVQTHPCATGKECDILDRYRSKIDSTGILSNNESE